MSKLTLKYEAQSKADKQWQEVTTILKINIDVKSHKKEQLSRSIIKQNKHTVFEIPVAIPKKDKLR